MWIYFSRTGGTSGLESRRFWVSRVGQLVPTNHGRVWSKISASRARIPSGGGVCLGQTPAKEGGRRKEEGGAKEERERFGVETGEVRMI